VETDRDRNTERVIVLLDANALMMPAQNKIDLFEELRRLLGAFDSVVLSGVLRELDGLARGKGRDAAAARLGKTLAARCSVPENQESGEPVDDQIISYAETTRCMVVTNDRVLRDALLSRGIRVISLVNDKKLDIIRR